MSVGKDMSVSVTADVAENPPSITLQFDSPGHYRISRKLPSDLAWVKKGDRPIGTSFVDQDVSVGVAYEYEIIRVDNSGSGYILAGSQIPLVDNRGKLVLVIEATPSGSLLKEWTQFVRDLVSEGYEVIVKFCVRTDSPEHVKSLIKTEYDADPANVRTVILFGAVPVKLSGLVNYDGHGAIPVAADGFYADMTGDWSNGPGIFPAHLNLIVGRIDFSNLVCYQNKPNNPRSELYLYREYLNRNHRCRTGQWPVTPRGAIRDGFTTENSSRDFSSNGWANMPQLCREGIDEIVDGQFFSALTSRDYLLSFACGGGQITSMAGLGGTTSGSDDFALNNIRSPFLMLLGSAFLGRWDKESSLPRAALASGNDEQGCLAVFGAGAPHVFLHRMALGGTIGESFLLSENNFTVYPASGNVEPPPGGYVPIESTGIPPCAGRVHQSFHGDPTLPLYPVPTVEGLEGDIKKGGVLLLSWFEPIVRDIVGCHVYRSANPNGPFQRLTTEPVKNIGAGAGMFRVTDRFAGLHYMVRAVKLVTTPSGSFYQASTGTMWSDSQTPPMPPTPGTTMSKANFVKSDAGDQGDWTRYGGDGYLVVAGDKSLPAYAQIVPGTHEQYEWENPLDDIRAPFANPNGSGKVAAVWHSGSAPGFTVDIKSDALPHRLALYFWDVDRTGRRQRVEILDGATDAVLDSREVLNFSDGLYLVYDYAGSIKIRITKIAGPNAVLSGLFFGPAGATPAPVPTPGATRTLDVLASTDGGATWKIVQTTEISATGTANAIFKLAIR